MTTDRTLIIKAVDTEKAAEGGPTVTRFVASTATPDRMGDIVEQSWDLEAYKSNPVILWAHDASIPPVGRAERAEVVGGQLEIDVRWDTGTELGRTVARQFAEGFLSAGSVGFRAGVMTPRSTLDKSDPRHGKQGYVLGENSLLEFSAVPVPANAQALAKSDGSAEAVVEGAIDLDALFARQEVKAALREHVKRAVAAELAARPSKDDWSDW